MGCDIHMFVEYKIDDGDWKPHKGHIVEIEEGTEWESGYVKQVSATGRNYSLFAALAGVRGEGPECKGLPDDISDTIKMAADQMEGDAHSHSYYDIEEFQKILDDLGYKPTDDIDMFYNWKDYNNYQDRPDDFTTIVAACKREAADLAAEAILLDAEPSVMKHRVVFFFDN